MFFNQNELFSSPLDINKDSNFESEGSDHNNREGEAETEK